MPDTSSPSFTLPKTEFTPETPIGGPDELVDFLKREVEFWAWHSSSGRFGAPKVASKVKAVSTASSTVATKVAQVDGTWSEEDIEEVEDALRVLVRDGPPLSSSSLAQVAKSLSESNGATASWYLAGTYFPKELHAAADTQGRDEKRKFAQAAMSVAALLDSGLLSGEEDLELAGLGARVETLHGTLGNLQKQADASVAQLEEQARIAVEEQERASSRREELEKQLEEQLGTSKAKVEEFEDYYNRQLALLKPVKYWRERRKRHQCSWYVLAALCALGFAGLCFASYTLSKALGVWPGTVVDVAVQAAPGVQGASPVPSVDFSRVALLVLAIGILVWPLRLLIRLFQREGHLRDDARHRETLTMTYLALLRDDSSHGSDEQRMLVLSHLFAPMGVDASDDGMPNGQLALLSTLLAGRSPKS